MQRCWRNNKITRAFAIKPTITDEFVTESALSRRGASSRVVIALILLAFIVGLAVMAWAVSKWNEGPAQSNGSDATQATSDPLAANVDTQNAMAAPTRPMFSYAPGAVDAQTARVLELEQRLSRIAVAAQAASGYASRAEAMLVAFAARRALDTGAPLDRIEGQLRLIFGQAQPRAVATIVNASTQPVTLPRLRAGLDEIGTAVSRGNPNENWWAAVTREVGSLVVVRRAGSPSAAPEARLVRARLDVESGQIDMAISEVEALRRDASVEAWLQQARRYNEAHRALDVIEAAALLEARVTPVVQVAPPVLQPQDTSPPAPAN